MATLTHKACVDYLSALSNKKIYKILPLYEERNEGVFKYIQSLTYELYGLGHVFNTLDANVDFITLLATFEALSDDCLFFEEDKGVIKREVFKCINIAKRILEKAESGGDK